MNAAPPVTPDPNAKFHGDMTRAQFIVHVQGLSLRDLEAQEDYTRGRLGEHNGILLAEIERRKKASLKRDTALPQPW
jgi:hypothetical protein